MGSAEPELQNRVRIFPDYARSVIWFCIGPMTYDEARITPGLRADMEAWERSYYDGIDDELYTWRSAAEHERFVAEGLRLAGWLSEELGDQFVVELNAVVGFAEEQSVFHSLNPATNREAAAAFQARALDLLEHERYVKRVTDAGGSFTIEGYTG